MRKRRGAQTRRSGGPAHAAVVTGTALDGAGRIVRVECGDTIVVRRVRHDRRILEDRTIRRSVSLPESNSKRRRRCAQLLNPVSLSARSVPMFTCTFANVSAVAMDPLAVPRAGARFVAEATADGGDTSGRAEGG